MKVPLGERSWWDLCLSPTNDRGMHISAGDFPSGRSLGDFFISHQLAHRKRTLLWELFLQRVVLLSTLCLADHQWGYVSQWEILEVGRHLGECIGSHRQSTRGGLSVQGPVVLPTPDVTPMNCFIRERMRLSQWQKWTYEDSLTRECYTDTCQMK